MYIWNMNRIIKAWSGIVVLLMGLIMVLLTGCGETSSPDKVLKVGISPDYPPFESYNNGEIIGLDPSLINAIGKHMNRQIQFYPLSFDNLIGALESKRVDLVISSMTKTPERENKFDFSLPYYRNSLSIVYRNGQPINSVEELKGKKIGAQTGSTMDLFLKKLGNVDISSLNNNNIMIEDLKLGRIDGVLLETVQAIQFAQSNLSLRSHLITNLDDETGSYSIAFPKGSALKNEVDSILTEMKQNGELQAIIQQWIPERMDPDAESK